MRSLPMRSLPVLVLLALAACSPAPAPDIVAPDRPAPQVRIEQVAVETQDPDWVTVTFRVTNETDRPVTYQGYGPSSPLYLTETLQAGSWQSDPIGWCGTGLEEQHLAPGASVELPVGVKRDGQSHRFSFGELGVTPPVTLD